MGASGAAAGVLFGGILTKYAGWEWIFFVNVPVGALVLALTRPVVRESRIPGLRGFDAGGAVTITSSLSLLVYAISKAPDVGWATGRTIGLLIASALLFVAFLVIETRSSSPLVSFDIFRIRNVTGANVCGFFLGAVVFSNFFLLTLYVQQVLGYSALKTGLTFLATAGTVIPAAGVSQALVTRVGPRPVMAVGLTLITGGMLWYTQIPVEGPFLTHLLPGYLLVGVGMGFSFVPMSIAALAGVAPQEAGLASGLINTSQQIGGALGVAIAATVAFTHTKTLLASGDSAASAATSGFALGFWVLAGIGAVSVVAVPRARARGRARSSTGLRQRIDLGERAGALPNQPNRREILREHRAARDPRRNPATVSLPRRQRCQRATATAPRVAVGAAAARRRDRDRSRTGRRPNRRDHGRRNRTSPRCSLLPRRRVRDGGRLPRR